MSKMVETKWESYRKMPGAGNWHVESFDSRADAEAWLLSQDVGTKAVEMTHWTLDRIEIERGPDGILERRRGAMV